MQGNYSILAATFPGFRVGPGSGSTIVFQVRQTDGGLLTINNTVASGLDTTNWNAYEIRFIGATPTTEAVVKVLVNGVQVAQALYGAGTLLPGFLRGTSAGYGIGVGNRGATGSYVPLCGVQIAAAPTESALL
jgi:hypothetical protein